MRLKHPFEIMEIEKQTFAVPVGEDTEAFSGVIRLSKTAAEIFRMLREETDEAAIATRMSERYEVAGDTLKADIHRVIELLREKDLLE